MLDNAFRKIWLTVDMRTILIVIKIKVCLVLRQILISINRQQKLNIDNFLVRIRSKCKQLLYEEIQYENNRKMDI